MRWLRVAGIILVVFFLPGVAGCVPSDKGIEGPCANGVVVPDPRDNPGLVADCTVLLQVRDTLAGSGTLNWSADRAIADWDGIKGGSIVNLWPPGITSSWEDEPSRVTELDLSERRFSGNVNGTIPPELGELAALTVLDLRNNHLSGRIPPELGALTELTVLDLRNNYLSGSIPPELGALTYLLGIGLHDNQLTGPIPPELGALANLQGLALDNNQLTGPIPPELGTLVNLGWLALDNNDLTGPIPPELGALANLEGLYLDSNQLTGPIPPELGYLTQLEYVSLHNNALTGCLPPALRRVPNNDFDKLGLPFCES